MEAVTAIKAAQERHRLAFAMDRLLHRLRRFVKAVPAMMDDTLPDHKIVWVDEIDRSGPAQTIIDAIKMHPELWAGALPPEFCIVHRETLKKYVGADAAEYMASHGENAVANQAARLLYETQYRERHERYFQHKSK